MLIAQLSDIHVCARGQLYEGVADANRLLADTIEQLNGLDPRPDLVIISGDLVNRGEAEEYDMLVGLLGALTAPYLVVPGNHDRREPFLAAFAHSHPYLPSEGPLHYCIETHPLRIVALDTSVPGQDHGYIDEVGLNWLRTTLAARPDKPTLIVMHHPPFISGIPYMDACRLMDAAPLESVLLGASRIEAVLCGHVHRPMMRCWAGTVAMTCPSTVTAIDLQLYPGGRPSFHLGPVGYMLHRWHVEDGLVSHVCDIGHAPGPYPFLNEEGEEAYDRMG